MLRYTRERPHGERTIFQVGAVRFGPDEVWNAGAPAFRRYIRLAPELSARIVKPDLRERVEREGGELDEVLRAFLDYIDEADAIVAYNGHAFDFPLLEEVVERALVEHIPARVRRIDGLYLSLAVWSVPPRQHGLSSLIGRDRFDEIKDRLGIDLTGLVAHDAADDCVMLVDLMRFAAAEVETWSPELRTLVRSVGRDSDAWRMLFGLCEASPEVAAFDAGEIRSTMNGALALVAKAPLRAPAPPSRAIDLSRLGSGGEIDIDRLVQAVRGPAATPRPSQRDMVEAMRGWVAEGADALVEAPTGTGKSFAILAIALEWLSADSAHRVVISTFTRQLQRQLANDIYALHEAGVVPGIIGQTSLIKGSVN